MSNNSTDNESNDNLNETTQKERKLPKLLNMFSQPRPAVYFPNMLS